MKESSVFNARKSTSCQILYFATAWKDRIGWIKSSQSYRNIDGISGEPKEFEWNIFPGFDTLQLYVKVKRLSILKYQKRSQEESIYVDGQLHFLWHERQ